MLIRVSRKFNYFPLRCHLQFSDVFEVCLFLSLSFFLMFSRLLLALKTTLKYHRVTSWLSLKMYQHYCKSKQKATLARQNVHRLLKENLVCNIATYCDFFLPSCLYPPLAFFFFFMKTFFFYVFMRLLFFVPNSNICHLHLIKWRSSPSHSPSAVAEMPALLATAADFCQRLSLNTSHIVFRGSDSYLLPRGCSPTTNGTLDGTAEGGSSGGRAEAKWKKRLLSADCALATNNTIMSKPVLKYFFVFVKIWNSVWWYACMCTSIDSQRRAVLQCKQNLKQPFLESVEFRTIKVLFLTEPKHRNCSAQLCVLLLSAGCIMLLGVCLLPSCTVSNTDKVAQKLC